jgi:hemin uptake protein HemP
MSGDSSAPEPAVPPPKRAIKAPQPTAASARRWRSDELFGHLHEIEIEHGEAIYRLRQTSLGKLILTK